MTNRRWTVRDGDREIHFTGQRLGESSSYSDSHTHDVSDACSACRWTEIAIYRTGAGSYVVAVRGCSDIAGEHLRSRAHISEAPIGVVESLHLYDDDGVRYLTHVARGALDAAFEHDEALREAFMVELLD